MIKKILISFCVLVLLTMSGATCGCGGGGKSNLPTVELTIWHAFDSEAVMKPIIDLYQQLNPNIKITYVKKDYAEYEKQTVDALAAGKGPDIWMIRNDWVYKHSDKLQSMTDKLFAKSASDARSDLAILKDMFPDIVSKDVVIDGKIYGIPLTLDTLALYYNTAHFTQAMNELINANRTKESEMFIYSPNDWESFLKMSEILTKKDANGNITRSGAALGTATNVDNASDILAALMLQNNTVMTSADQKTATFNLPVTKETGEIVYAGTQALNFYTSFADSSKENYMWNSSMPDSVSAFEQGKVSMIIDYGVTRNRLAQEAPNLNYKIGPLPQVAGATSSTDYASYWVETVTNNSQNPKEAWKFIKYLSENAAQYSDATGRPIAKRISDLSIPPTKQRNIIGGIPFFYQPMTAKYWYKGVEPIKVDNAFYNMIEDVTTKKEPQQKAIDAAAAIVTQLYGLSVPSAVLTPTPTATK